MSWMADAERVRPDQGWFLIGEDENGLLCGPTRRRYPDGQRVWRPYIRVSIGRLLSSWLQRKIVWLELPPASVI
jgi:hypothetical protein